MSKTRRAQFPPVAFGALELLLQAPLELPPVGRAGERVERGLRAQALDELEHLGAQRHDHRAGHADDRDDADEHRDPQARLDEQGERDRARGAGDRDVDGDLARGQEIGGDEHRPEEERGRQADGLGERHHDGDHQRAGGRDRVEHGARRGAPDDEQRGDQRAGQRGEPEPAVVGRVGVRREGDEAERQRAGAEQQRSGMPEPPLRRGAVPVVDRTRGIDDARRTERHRARVHRPGRAGL